MIKKFFSAHYKKPLFWIIPAAVLVCAAAVIAVINPFEKAEGEPKKDMPSQEVTVKEDGASKDNTASSKDTATDDQVTTSNPVVSEEPVTSSKPVTSSEPEKVDPAEELAAKRKELFDKLSPTQTVEVRNQVVDWLLSDSKESEKKLYTREEAEKLFTGPDIDYSGLYVYLTEEASKEFFFKYFTPADFPGVDCEKIVNCSDIRNLMLTGKIYGNEEVLEKFEPENLCLKIYLNTDTKEAAVDNFMKLQEFSFVEYAERIVLGYAE